MKTRHYKLTCINCGTKFTSLCSTTKLCEDCKKKECPVCGEKKIPYSRYSHNICTECYKKLPGFGVKRTNYIGFCNKHGHYIGGGMCPICETDIRTIKCIECGKTYIEKEQRLGRLMNNEGIHACEECKKKAIGNGNILRKCARCGSLVYVNNSFSVCPNCHKSMIEYDVKCKYCGKIFKSFSNTSKICEDCLKDVNKPRSVKRLKSMLSSKNFYLENNIIIAKTNTKQDKRGFKERECLRCGRKFMPVSPRQKVCKKCFIINTCENCGAKFVSSHGGNARFCSPNCSAKKQIRNSDEEHIKSINRRIEQSKNKINIENYLDICDSNFCNFKGFPGIWFIYSKEKDVVLDVHITTDIADEILKIKKRIEEKRTAKYVELNKWKESMSFKFLCNIENWEDGLVKEMDFAEKSSALFWNPSPGYQIDRYNREHNTNRRSW